MSGQRLAKLEIDAGQLLSLLLFLHGDEDAPADLRVVGGDMRAEGEQLTLRLVVSSNAFGPAEGPTLPLIPLGKLSAERADALASTLQESRRRFEELARAAARAAIEEGTVDGAPRPEVNTEGGQR